MATKQSAQYPYRWANGSWHSKPQGPTNGGSNGTVAIGGVPVTQSTWASGGLANALVPGSYPAAQPPPADAGLDMAKVGANRNIALGNSEAAVQEGDLGFDAGYNADGTVNTSNPYSRAALLQLAHEQQTLGTTNSMAAAGQLYSGARANAQAGVDTNYARNEAGNRLAYQRGLHSIKAGQLTNYANNSIGVSDADFNGTYKSVYPGS